MIHIFADAVYTAVSGLNFIERWGGAVMPVTIRGSYEDTQTGQTASYQQTVPISCSIAEECEPESDGFYTKLLPDDSYKSVAWLESRGNAVMEAGQSGAIAALFAVRQRVRLTVWLNMQRLGALSCGGHIPFMASAIKALNNNVGNVAVAGFSLPVKTTVKRIDIVERNPATVFGAYTYAIQNRLFIHPYNFFALDLDMEAMLPMGCFCPVEIEAVECLEVW